VRELTWIIDPATGSLVAEGIEAQEVPALAGDLLPPAREVNCARPLRSQALSSAADSAGPVLRVARLYHGSVVDGPGRRSVVQLQGCPIRCRGCYVPETHDPTGGVPLTIAEIVGNLLNPVGEPRDGVTVTGGEAFSQPVGLAAVLKELKLRGVHTVVYSGYTLEVLARRPEPEVWEALYLIDLLVDGPFVAALAEGAGEWRGSRNQRLIPRPARVLAARHQAVTQVARQDSVPET
jgi:anaerobic ribonucleoside-triphosphate reductase activating protein